jgi:hypothetical protein
MESALSGRILKIFPIPNDPNNKWVSSLELNEAGLKGMDSTYTKSVLPLYYGSLNNASQSNNYQNADDLVESLNGFKRNLEAKYVLVKIK